MGRIQHCELSGIHAYRVSGSAGRLNRTGVERGFVRTRYSWHQHHETCLSRKISNGQLFGRNTPLCAALMTPETGVAGTTGSVYSVCCFEVVLGMARDLRLAFFASSHCETGASSLGGAPSRRWGASR